MPACAICLAATADETEYHARCVESLFGTSVIPSLDTARAEVYRLAAKMAGKMSISGVQEKISLTLSRDKKVLELAPTGGRYILKPEPARFSSVPENEHVTMCLALLVGIATPPFGLVRLKDGSLAYVIKRFDRRDDGSKLHVEDFCQLSEKPLRDKYQGSGELCVRILRKYASEPLIEVRKLYQLLLFSWWTANGDQHLKNFSLLTSEDHFRRLAPAYDLVCTRLVIPDDQDLALSIAGKKRNITRGLWLDFASYCQIPERAAERLLNNQAAALEPSVRLIHDSFLPSELKTQYEAIVRENTAAIAGAPNRRPAKPRR